MVHSARARAHAEFFRTERGEWGPTVEPADIGVRAVFALRFGHVRTDDAEYISQDAVRASIPHWLVPANTECGAMCRELPYTADVEAFDGL